MFVVSFSIVSLERFVELTNFYNFSKLIIVQSICHKLKRIPTNSLNVRIIVNYSACSCIKSGHEKYKILQVTQTPTSCQMLENEDLSQSDKSVCLCFGLQSPKILMCVNIIVYNYSGVGLLLFVMASVFWREIFFKQSVNLLFDACPNIRRDAYVVYIPFVYVIVHFSALKFRLAMHGQKCRILKTVDNALLITTQYGSFLQIR